MIGEIYGDQVVSQEDVMSYYGKSENEPELSMPFNMNLLGLIAALSAGIFFGFIGPTTKLAYNLGASIGLAIILRYIVGTILIIPALFYKPPSIDIFKSNITILMLFTLSSIIWILQAVNFLLSNIIML